MFIGIINEHVLKQLRVLRCQNENEHQEIKYVKEALNMNTKLVQEVAASQLRNDLPEFSSGDEIKVSVKIIEGAKTRIQNFQGVVICRRGGGVSETFTVRKMSSGIGVERTFPIHSPNIAGIEIVRRGKVRRNKITYIRQRSGKSARIKEILK